MTQHPVGTIARIHVSDGPVDSWPLAERTARGWQSGVMFYPLEKVVDVETTFARVVDGATAADALYELRVNATSHRSAMSDEGFDAALAAVIAADRVARTSDDSGAT